jgi:hypothetical protein
VFPSRDAETWLDMKVRIQASACSGGNNVVDGPSLRGKLIRAKNKGEMMGLGRPRIR